MQVTRQNSVSVIIVLFILVQIGILFIFGPTPYHDSDCYVDAANKALAYGELYPSVWQIRNDGFIWNIGAIDLVQVSLYLFGSVVPVLLLYSVFKGVTAWLFYQVTKKLTSGKIAFMALLIYVCYPANYGESTSLLSELPFMFFVFVSLYFAVCRESYILCAVFLVIANTFRPLSLLFLIAIIIYLLLRKKDVIRNCCRMIVAYVACIMLIGGLSYVRTGHFFYQATTGWYNFVQSNEFDNEIDLAANEHKIIPEARQLDCIEKDVIWRKRAIQWTMDNPDRYMSKWLHTLTYTYVSDNTGMCTFVADKDKKDDIYGEVSMPCLIRSFPHYSKVQILTVVNLAYYYMLLSLFIIGIGRIFREYTHVAGLCVSVVLFGSMLLVLFSHSESRYHIPFMPFIIMMDACVISLYSRASSLPVSQRDRKQG